MLSSFKRSDWNVVFLYASQFIHLSALSFAFLLPHFCIYHAAFCSLYILVIFFHSSDWGRKRGRGGVRCDSYGAHIHILALVSPFLLCHVIPAALRMRSVGRVALCGCCICYFANLLQIFTYDLLFERAALSRRDVMVGGFLLCPRRGYGCGLKAAHIKNVSELWFLVGSVCVNVCVCVGLCAHGIQ